LTTHPDLRAEGTRGLLDALGKELEGEPATA
jgi:hypothetical protein